jgi:Ala-tRNA(Pro) deacylase
MCILPAIHYLDLGKLKAFTGVEDIKLASENDIAKLFRDYEVGAEPPFGHLYDIKIIIDQFLQDDNEVVFNAGTHTDMIRMKLTDFLRLAKPTFADIGVHIAAMRH